MDAEREEEEEGEEGRNHGRSLEERERNGERSYDL